jgi:hypothetical protein
MPVTAFKVRDPYRYQDGFGSYHQCVIARLAETDATGLTRSSQDRSSSGCAACRPELSAESSAWSVHGEALRHVIHRPSP